MQPDKIRIIPVSPVSFFVEVLDEGTGKYLRHEFAREQYRSTLTYGEGKTREVDGCDIWFSPRIWDEEGVVVLQGNTNFIHYLEEKGHTGHVGSGHGCVVQELSLFFADGRAFDPATLQEPIVCSRFRFLTRARHYLIDTANTHSSVRATPTPDENGEPIVTSLWSFDGEWTVNNRIAMRNRLRIVRDGLRFTQCFCGMLCGFYPDMTDVVAESPRGIELWNRTSEERDYENEDVGGTGTVLRRAGLTSVLGDTATLFGKRYVARQTMINNDPRRYGTANMSIWMPPNGDGRLKVYFQPCITEHSACLLSEGRGVEVFSAGDTLDVTLYRSVDFAK